MYHVDGQWHTGVTLQLLQFRDIRQRNVHGVQPSICHKLLDTLVSPATTIYRERKLLLNGLEFTFHHPMQFHDSIYTIVYLRAIGWDWFKPKPPHMLIRKHLVD
jgi:hypothetical protein